MWGGKKYFSQLQYTCSKSHLNLKRLQYDFCGLKYLEELIIYLPINAVIP